MTTQQKQVIAKCNEVFQLVKEIYGFDLSNIDINFDLKGRVAGKACGRRSNGIVKYSVFFNANIVKHNLEEMLNEVVPHEIAHIVCFVNPLLGRHHDAGWAYVCKRLGGNGKRTHGIPVIHGKGNTYEYTTTNGNTIRLGEHYHKQVQTGNTLSLNRNKGTVNSTCEYSIVGRAGQAFDTPISKRVAEASATKRRAPTFFLGQPDTSDTRFAGTVAGLGIPETISPLSGESKASLSRKIMINGHRSGIGYEAIIAEMIAVNGYTRQLARATYLANYVKAGVPAS